MSFKERNNPSNESSPLLPRFEPEFPNVPLVHYLFPFRRDLLEFIQVGLPKVFNLFRWLRLFRKRSEDALDEGDGENGLGLLGLYVVRPGSLVQLEQRERLTSWALTAWMTIWSVQQMSARSNVDSMVGGLTTAWVWTIVSKKSLASSRLGGAGLMEVMLETICMMLDDDLQYFLFCAQGPTQQYHPLCTFVSCAVHPTAS